ncbi:MAG: class I SAM-dependent methyltransferase [Candidatus Omnitrophica bacterium]|jgi:ubiquinone/menaquinone biosynthesis C-methylase UbiE|nr:class I SAM-dependent methyltransferase [Candidatus Omnitrophota bacterium]
MNDILNKTSDDMLVQVWDKYWHSGNRNILAEMKFNLDSHQGRITFDLLGEFKKGDKILEAGSGLGNWVFLFEKIGFHVTGVDLSPISLKIAGEYAHKNNLNPDFILADIRSIPVQDNYFNVAVSYGVIEHFKDPENALKEMHRVLKPGGACLITVPNPFSFHRLIGRHILDFTKSYKLGYVGYEAAYTPKGLSMLISNAGFTNIKSGPLSDGMGMLFGEFWGFIPLIGKKVKRSLAKFASLIESKQNIIGGGSFAIGYKTKP